MRWGICTGIEHLAIVEQAGYDYIELPVTMSLQPDQDGFDISNLEKELSGSRVAAETFNILLPSDLKIVGNSIDIERQDRYLEQAFARASALGAGIVVFGSGGSRRRPERFSKSATRSQILDFLYRAGRIAMRYRLTFVIEPLNQLESNQILTVVEAVEFVTSVNLPSVKVLADLYHMTAEREPVDVVSSAGSLLAHVHVAGAADRRAPSDDDAAFLRPFFHALKEMDYGGRISVEARWEDMADDAEKTLIMLRRVWETA